MAGETPTPSVAPAASSGTAFGAFVASASAPKAASPTPVVSTPKTAFDSFVSSTPAVKTTAFNSFVKSQGGSTPAPDPMATPAIVQASTSPYKLSGATTISQAPAPKAWPGGFIGRAAQAAYNTAKNTIEDTATKIDSFLGTTTAQSKLNDMNKYSDANGNLDLSKVPSGLVAKNIGSDKQTLVMGMTAEQWKTQHDALTDQASPASKASNLGEAGVGIANLALLQYTTEISAATQVPILKYPANAANAVLGKFSDIAKATLGYAVDHLDPSIVSDSTKQTIKPFVQDLGTFIAQLGAFHFGAKAIETGGSGLLDKTGASDATKSIVSGAVKHTVGLSMAPFSHLFGIASGLFTQKILSRPNPDAPVTKKEGTQILNEVKDEVKQEVNTIKNPPISDEDHKNVTDSLANNGVFATHEALQDQHDITPEAASSVIGRVQAKNDFDATTAPKEEETSGNGDPTKLSFNSFVKGDVSQKNIPVTPEEAQKSLLNAGYSPSEATDIINSLDGKEKTILGRTAFRSIDISEAAFAYSTPEEEPTSTPATEPEPTPEEAPKVTTNEAGTRSIVEQNGNAEMVSHEKGEDPIEKLTPEQKDRLTGDVEKPSKGATDANKLLVAKGFKEIPEEEMTKYGSGVVSEQREKIGVLLADRERFDRIATGEEPLPDGIKGSMLYNVAMRTAYDEGNESLMSRVGSGPLARESSEAGSSLRFSQEGRGEKGTGMRAVTDAIETTNKAKEKSVEKELNKKGSSVAKEKAKEMKKAADAVKEVKSKPKSRPKLEAFIDSITTC